jgi:hypothetical protein
MLKISSMLVGSFIGFACYKTSTFMYKCLPYLTKPAYNLAYSSNVRKYVIVNGATGGIGK